VTTPVIPRNDDELAEMLGDTTSLKKIAASKESLKEFISAYARKAAAEGTDLADQIEAEVQRGLVKYLADNGIQDAGNRAKRLNLSPDANPMVTGAKLGNQFNPNAPGAAINHLFNSTGDYLKAIWHGSRSAESLKAQSDIRSIQNTFGSIVPSDGGFLIPEYLRAELLRVALERSLVRPRARIVPMETLTVPFPTIDDTSHASNVYGGVTAYWTEEAGALTTTSATFGRVRLEAKKLTTYTEVPNELFQDSVLSLQMFINQIFPEAMAWFEDVAFINGTGVGEPLGFLNADAAVSVTKESGQAANTILWENIVKMYSRMLPTSLDRAVWIAHIDTFPELATMALSVGTGGSAVWIGQGLNQPGSAGPPMSILGRPIFFTEKVPSVGSAGDINFVDLGYYLVGDRQTMSADTSPHYKFANDQTAMRFIQRVDGQPWIQSAITPHQGSNSLTPFVKIAVRA
jgi:HK97 family phage major capsid protein